MPNSSYTLSLLAKEDLLDTFEKGIKQWGINKATEYAQSIEDLLTVLSRHPAMGHARDELASNIKSFPVGSHIIFYRQHNDTIEIARILHQRMDESKHL